MNTLSKKQKDEYATAFAMLALYDGGASISADQINALLTATNNTEVEAFYPIIFANYLNDPTKIGQFLAFPSSGGGGGGGGGGSGGGGDAAGGDGGAAEEAKPEEKEEEVEMDLGGGMDMFGGDEEGGGGGDY